MKLYFLENDDQLVVKDNSSLHGVRVGCIRCHYTALPVIWQVHSMALNGSWCCEVIHSRCCWQWVISSMGVAATTTAVL